MWLRQWFNQSILLEPKYTTTTPILCLGMHATRIKPSSNWNRVDNLCTCDNVCILPGLIYCGYIDSTPLLYTVTLHLSLCYTHKLFIISPEKHCNLCGSYAILSLLLLSIPTLLSLRQGWQRLAVVVPIDPSGPIAKVPVVGGVLAGTVAIDAMLLPDALTHHIGSMHYYLSYKL